MSHTEFKDLPLIEPLQRALAEKGYAEPSPIQAQAIPLLLEGRDLLACAQTGTGKTAAFALPMLNRIATQGRKPFRRGVRNLILVPTRELAVQVTESFRTYGAHLDLKTR
jgi:ATP-dependent RNA helicase RhlE